MYGLPAYVYTEGVVYRISAISLSLHLRFVNSQLYCVVYAICIAWVFAFLCLLPITSVVCLTRVKITISQMAISTYMSLSQKVLLVMDIIENDIWNLDIILQFIRLIY